MGSGLLKLHGSGSLHHLRVVGAEPISDLPVKQLVFGLAEYL
jgi:hypothetical protein